MWSMPSIFCVLAFLVQMQTKACCTCRCGFADLLLLHLLKNQSFDGLTRVPRSSFQIDAAGSYHFFTESDDGSNLYIDGIHLINNDGLHPPQMKGAHITLSKGFHFLRVTFFEAQGGALLKVTYKGADTGMEEIPVYAWLPPSAPDQVNVCMYVLQRW